MPSEVNVLVACVVVHATYPVVRTMAWTGPELVCRLIVQHCSGACCVSLFWRDDQACEKPATKGVQAQNTSSRMSLNPWSELVRPVQTEITLKWKVVNLQRG